MVKLVELIVVLAVAKVMVVVVAVGMTMRMMALTVADIAEVLGWWLWRKGA